MKLFDSLSRLPKFLPDNKLITIYICGPTLYDQLHLGNLRPIITFDFLIRYLKSRGISYYYIQNLTDIDEKILKKAFNTGESVKNLTSRYYNSFLDILKNLNVVLPSNFPSVSENIEEIQRVTECLISTGAAYWDRNSQTVKFNQVEKDDNLNYFYSSEATSLEEADFALWKENKLSSFNYDSPWFKGIPGWHIECFAMIQRYFELPITIHGGGVDLKFPHHENENLLCRSLFKKELAETWVHVGQVLNEEGKLSKSSNLQFSIEECAGAYSWTFLRYIFLKSKYHKPITITKSLLEEYWGEWKSFVSSLNYAEALLVNERASPWFKRVEITSPEHEFLKSIEDNLNLPETLSWLEGVKKKLLQSLKNRQLGEIEAYSASLRYHLSWLGFELPSLKSEQVEKTKEWLNLVEKEEYVSADILRSKLQEEGILP
ncbi:class I tRNA ligase family protein [Candidatus Mycoplasma haematominutum]|uniref:Cysteinyl-tRNA synthetase n=1 Tax=Candidatus Mycoplasma haematominutum 'Birmingham 1' TaxID=1116213 RepID=G8C2T1_9MOLU|nr:class I tRNA ligase family protein [Candidatus Mycoplasma haematominutum]CCE66629.1 cysteinyl-tRNA synthetase [Candidatus Mycoplasma haematominutum 'Birmingham 1']